MTALRHVTPHDVTHHMVQRQNASAYDSDFMLLLLALIWCVMSVKHTRSWHR